MTTEHKTHRPFLMTITRYQMQMAWYRQLRIVAIRGSYTGCTGCQDDRQPSATPTYIADGYHSQSWRPATQYLAVEGITPAGGRRQVVRNTDLMSSNIQRRVCTCTCLLSAAHHACPAIFASDDDSPRCMHESHELRCLTAVVDGAAWRSCVPSQARDLQVVPLARVHHAGDVAAAAAHVAGGVVAHLPRAG